MSISDILSDALGDIDNGLAGMPTPHELENVLTLMKAMLRAMDSYEMLLPEMIAANPKLEIVHVHIIKLRNAIMAVDLSSVNAAYEELLEAQERSSDV